MIVLADQRLELRQRLFPGPALAAALLQRPGECAGHRNERKRAGYRPPGAEDLPHHCAGSGADFGFLETCACLARDLAGGLAAGSEARLDCGDDPVADLVLQGERVLEQAIVALGPDVLVLWRIDELGGHPHAVVDFAYAAFDDVLAAELARDRPRVDLAALVGGGGLAGHDLEARQRLQPRRQVLDDAVGEVLLRRIVAHIREGQDDDRAGLDAGRQTGRGRRCRTAVADDRRNSTRAPARSGNPSISRTVVKVIVQAGRFSAGRTTDATWTSSHPTTAYAAATRKTLRFFSSPSQAMDTKDSCNTGYGHRQRK